MMVTNNVRRHRVQADLSGKGKSSALQRSLGVIPISRNEAPTAAAVMQRETQPETHRLGLQ